MKPGSNLPPSNQEKETKLLKNGYTKIWGEWFSPSNQKLGSLFMAWNHFQK